MADSAAWLFPPKPPVLAENELHVWRASLDLSPDVIERFQITLSEHEKERAQRFLVPQARERFIAGRGILRELLGRYLALAPEEIEFQYGPDGKPSLSAGHNSAIRFSVSHSQDMALFAMAAGSEVGVDIEAMKADFRGMQIASHFFSDEEVASLARLEQKSATEGFFACWTKKEAYVKARGKGLGIPLRSFTVKFAEDKQGLQDEEGKAWSCYTLTPSPEFSGAVVVAGEDWKLRYWEWSAGEMSLDRLRSNART